VRGVNIFTIVGVITTVSISSAMRGWWGEKRLENGKERKCVKYLTMTVELSSSRRSREVSGLVTLPAYVGDDPFLVERSAVRVGRAVQGNVSEQDQGRVFV